MPRLSTSDHARDRLTHLIKRLLAYANHELNDDQTFAQMSIRWLEQRGSGPKLVVQATLEDLATLISAEPSNRIAKDQIRHDLRLLREFLQILEDNRTKTQGSGIWHFTLRLWHSSTEKNLIELKHHWEQCKSEKLNRLSRRTEKRLNSPLPERDHVSPTDKPAQLCCNLPARDYTQFIGRIKPFNQLLEWLDLDCPVARIGISGTGGVGKTSLALEVAYRCCAAHHGAADPYVPIFDTIIFTSAKPQRLTMRGILPSGYQERTLQQICRAILKTLDNASWLNADLADQIERIQTIFACRHVLLIIDNLETVEEEQSVLAFLYAMPATVKVVVTSCDRSMMDPSIHLEPLSEAEGSHFIQQQAKDKAIDLFSAAPTLYQVTGGIPAAIVYAIGQLANGYLLPDVLPRLTLAKGDFCRFYFEQSVKLITDQPAHQLLMTVALFPEPTMRAIIVQVAGLPEVDASEGLARLHQLSLITLQAERYTVLPLTQKYALAELQSHPGFEQSARERWVVQYYKFCQQHGNLNWKEWHDYTALDREWTNIQAVVEWCIEQNRYQNFCEIWQYIRGYTNLYGYSGDRLNWTHWWIQAAQQHSDHAVIAQAQCDRAWTLISIGKPDYLVEAEQLLQQAWVLGATNLHFQLDLSLEHALLCIFQSQLTKAQHWLEQSEDLLPQVQLNAFDQSRYAIRIDYYKAEVWCRQGDHDQAKTLFHRVLEAARTVGWQQVEIYTLNWLAEIALVQTDLDQAEILLMQSLPIAQQQQDKRSIAFHAKSKAYLEHLRGNELDAQQWFQTAIESFTDLGMDSEVQEMDERMH